MMKSYRSPVLPGTMQPTLVRAFDNTLFTQRESTIRPEFNTQPNSGFTLARNTVGVTDTMGQPKAISSGSDSLLNQNLFRASDFGTARETVNVFDTVGQPTWIGRKF